MTIISSKVVNKSAYPREKDIIQWSSDRKILQNSTRAAQLEKLEEEFYELCEAVDGKDLDGIRDAIGDMYVVMTNIAAMSKLGMEECVEAAYKEIKDRKGYLNERGVFVKEES